MLTVFTVWNTSHLPSNVFLLDVFQNCKTTTVLLGNKNPFAELRSAVMEAESTITSNDVIVEVSEARRALLRVVVSFIYAQTPHELVEY